MHTITVLTHPVVVDHTNRTLRPLTDRGDDYFGLAPLTNGTAAECRRALIQVPGHEWVRSSGKPPTGINYVSKGRSGEEWSAGGDL